MDTVIKYVGRFLAWLQRPAQIGFTLRVELNPVIWWRIACYRYHELRYWWVTRSWSKGRDPSAEQKPRYFKDVDLRYSATTTCDCGAGLAYPKGIGVSGYWDCSDILTGRAVPKGQPGAMKHCDQLPFAFYEIRSEDQHRGEKRSTRPPYRSQPRNQEVKHG